MTTPIIQTHSLTKAYKRSKTPALSGLDLTVNQGEIFGYLGPNGAGKTTTIRLLLDLIRPTSGSATIFGLDVHHDSVQLHRRIGFLPGELNLWDELTGQEVLCYLGRIRGSYDTAYIKQLTEQLGLDVTKRVRSYSLGNKRKLGLITALMHKPDLLILDEPSNGLDPLMQQTFHQMMLEARNAGRTIFLSSHMLNEVQAICERVAILRDGKLETVERVSDLVHVKFHWVTLTFKQPVAPQQFLNLPGVTEVSANANELRLRLTGDIDPVLKAINNDYVINIRTQEPSLEEIFLTFYGGQAASASVQQPITESVKEVVR